MLEDRQTKKLSGSQKVLLLLIDSQKVLLLLIDCTNGISRILAGCKTMDGFKKKLEKIRNTWTGQANNRLSERRCRKVAGKIELYSKHSSMYMCLHTYSVE